MAEHCLKSAKDLSGLLLLYSARGSAPGLRALTDNALEGGKHNVAFLARFLLGDLPGCVDLLLDSGRIPEAAFFARTYLPSRISEVRSPAEVLLSCVARASRTWLYTAHTHRGAFRRFSTSTTFSRLSPG